MDVSLVHYERCQLFIVYIIVTAYYQVVIYIFSLAQVLNYLPINKFVLNLTGVAYINLIFSMQCER